MDERRGLHYFDHPRKTFYSKNMSVSTVGCFLFNFDPLFWWAFKLLHILGLEAPKKVLGRFNPVS